jgi:hypothetical protein
VWDVEGGGLLFQVAVGMLLLLPLSTHVACLLLFFAAISCFLVEYGSGLGGAVRAVSMSKRLS